MTVLPLIMWLHAERDTIVWR